ncbi:MAG: tRNA (adenosine(37)-N6)-threonylcarbamoyltransferase complex dimerization subunit type 1 TsaB [Gemmatimonadaceae bacterium]
MITLALDAATYAGSVAVLDGSTLMGERTVAMRGRDSEALMPAVAAVLEECRVEPAQLGRVVCGAGPGSFTSLRIAGGIAKGIAMAIGIPLVPVSSLALVVASSGKHSRGRYLAALDALRGEHYVELYEVAADGDISLLWPARRVASSELERTADQADARLVGEGTTGVSTRPHARSVAHLTKMLDSTAPADLARWEPAYGRLAEAQVRWEAEHGRPLVPR